MLVHCSVSMVTYMIPVSVSFDLYKIAQFKLQLTPKACGVERDQ